MVSWNVPTATDNGADVPLRQGPSFNSAFLPTGFFGPFQYFFDDTAGNTAVCNIYAVVSGKLRSLISSFRRVEEFTYLL